MKTFAKRLRLGAFMNAGSVLLLSSWSLEEVVF